MQITLRTNLDLKPGDQSLLSKLGESWSDHRFASVPRVGDKVHIRFGLVFRVASVTWYIDKVEVEVNLLDGIMPSEWHKRYEMGHI